MKQLEPREVSVGENQFFIRPLPAFKAANMSGELASLLLPMLSGIAPLLGSVDPEKPGNGLMDVNIEEAAPAITGAFSSISGDKVEELLRHLLITGGNIAFQTPDDERPQRLTQDLADELFCTDVQDMFILAFEVIRTNYNGFFKKLGARFGPLAEGLMKTAAPSGASMGLST